MNPLHRVLFVFVLLVLTLAACGPQSTPTESSPDTSGVPVTGGEATPELDALNLGGPEMRVGATYLYADGSLLVPVPAGPFTMGANGPDNPEHQVVLPDFWIYRNKVTNGQYAYCVAVGICTSPSQSDNPGFDDPLDVNDPVVGVDYNQAKTYCAYAAARLPSEAEWEKTARGIAANIYPWGDAEPTCGLLNFGNCIGKTTPVNSYPSGQSYYQAYDMEGNTLEWVADWYRADYYLHSPLENPLGPDSGQERSVRSSAFNSGGNQTQTFNRFHERPDIHRANLGFRCVVEDPSYFAPFCDYPAVYGTDGIGGGATGEKIDVECPAIGIDQSLNCENGKPVTIVTFTSVTGAAITVPQPGCDQSPLNSDKYTCTENGQLKICAQCTVTVSSPPLCPEGYNYDPTTKTCTGRRGTGTCLPGFTLGTRPTRGVVLTENTPVANSTPAGAGDQCCTFDPGSPTFTRGTGPSELCEYLPNTHIIACHPPFPSCPTGTTFDGQECIGVQTQSPICKTEGVSLSSCTGGGGDGGGCPPPPGGCPMSGEQWNPNSCSCYCPAGPGYCG